MRTKNNQKNNLSQLRKNAEEKLRLSKKSSKKDNLLEFEHELNVHKVELEMQNEELLATQLKLEESLKNYSELFEFAPIGYFILDKLGIIINVNDTGSNLLGRTRTQLTGKPFSTFLSSELGQDNFYRHRNQVIETEKLEQIECEIKRNEGYEFPALITSSIIKDEQGEFKYFLSTLSDISERKEQERLVNLALAKEKELNELKSRFITIASHEFRTPLATILLSAELLEKYNAPKYEENRKKHFYKIKSSVQGLTEILTDFLSLNKFENGLINNNPTLFNIVKFTEKIIEEINIIDQPIEYKHIGDHRVVNLDPKLLKVCLSNLIGNAIKYSPKEALIKVVTRMDVQENIKITIKDIGIGVPESDKPFLFDQFFRAKNAESFQGTGLGLNIVQKFVSIMNGTISFTSKEDQGATFVMTFPKM
jgi:two-component system sensor kinase FixL